MGALLYGNEIVGQQKEILFELPRKSTWACTVAWVCYPTPVTAVFADTLQLDLECFCLVGEAHERAFIVKKKRRMKVLPWCCFNADYGLE